ncbi:crosslink repair DNA glycosylase YcaQ family protein, partial [Cupriavidus sp. 2MCAB6]
VLIEKDHAWASRKPSKRALQLAFFSGALTICERAGMLKSYELPERHFGWERAPRPATEKQVLDYLLDRALRSQGIVSLDSVCHLDAPRKPAIRELIETRLRRRTLVPVTIEGAGKQEHWAQPAMLEPTPAPDAELVHI